MSALRTVILDRFIETETEFGQVVSAALECIYLNALDQEFVSGLQPLRLIAEASHKLKDTVILARATLRTQPSYASILAHGFFSSA